MVSLFISLLFIGFCSPSFSVTGDVENKQSSGRFITLRDYDFVGEDPTLVARLAERMAVLQAPLNLSELKPPSGPRAPAAQLVWQQWQRHAFPLQPDYLRSSLKLPQMVNVSMDYAELANVSDLVHEADSSSPVPGPAAEPEFGFGAAQRPGSEAALVPYPAAALVPGPGATLVPGPAEALVPGLRAALVPNPYGPPNLSEALGPGPAEGSEPGATPAPGASAPHDSGDGRRTNVPAYNYKILDLMKHNIYNTQRKILELDLIIKKHERDPRYRMAYIYNRLDEWKQNLRSLHYAMYRWRYYHLRIKRLIWYYEHSLRINIDITYSVEHLLHLHSEYMKKMEDIVPLSTRQAIEELKKKQRKVAKMKAMGFPEGTIV